MISLQTWALAAGLLMVGLSVWYFLQPLSADALYKRIAAETKDESIESLRRAEDDINSFLQQFPKDPRAFKLRNYQREIDLYRRELNFDRRVKGLAGAESTLPVERAYLEAISYEKLSPERCIAKLQALLDLYQYNSETAEPVGDCLVLARRRLDQLKQEVGKHAPEQLKIIGQRLDEADRLATTDPQRAESMYRAAVELYADKPWAAEAVRRAKRPWINSL